MAIGIVAVSGQRYAWLPISLGILGSALLLNTSFLLIRESRIALNALNAEMDFVLRQGQQHAPADLLRRRGTRGVLSWIDFGSARGEDEQNRRQ